MYPTAVMFIFWAWAFFSVACKFWLPCHISKMLWILAILCNVVSSALRFILVMYSVLVVSNGGSSGANNALPTRAHCLIMTLAQTVSPVVVDYLQLIVSRTNQKQGYTPTVCGTIEKMLHAIIGWSTYIHCVSSCWRCQLVMTGLPKELLMCIGSAW